MPERPWQDLALDFPGPMPTEHRIVLIDYYSRWKEVDIVHTTTSEKVIKCLYVKFARYGVPKSFRKAMDPIWSQKKLNSNLMKWVMNTN